MPIIIGICDRSNFLSQNKRMHRTVGTTLWRHWSTMCGIFRWDVILVTGTPSGVAWVNVGARGILQFCRPQKSSDAPLSPPFLAPPPDCRPGRSASSTPSCYATGHSQTICLQRIPRYLCSRPTCKNILVAQQKLMETLKNKSPIIMIFFLFLKFTFSCYIFVHYRFV